MLAEATVVFIASLCFSEDFMRKLARAIENSRTVRAVATLQKFPELRHFQEDLPAETCETSWSARPLALKLGPPK